MMGKCLIFLMLLLLGVSGLAFGQQKAVDVVYAKSGKIYQGKILPETDDRRIRLQTKDLSILWFNKSEVDSIGTVQMDMVPDKDRDSTAMLFWPKHLTYNVEANIGRLVGLDWLFNQPGHFWTTGLAFGLGFNCTHHLVLGAEVGLEKTESTILVPTIFNVRVRLRAKALSPVIALGIGYAFARDLITDPLGQQQMDLDRWGGTYANPALGVSSCVSPKLELHAFFGLRVQNVHHRFLGTGVNTLVSSNESWYLNLKLGATF